MTDDGRPVLLLPLSTEDSSHIAVLRSFSVVHEIRTRRLESRASSVRPGAVSVFALHVPEIAFWWVAVRIHGIGNWVPQAGISSICSECQGLPDHVEGDRVRTASHIQDGFDRGVAISAGL